MNYYHHRLGVFIPFAKKYLKFIILTSLGIFALFQAILLIQHARAAVTYSVTEFTPSELSNWTVDRYAPSGGYVSETFGGRDDVLAISIDNENGNSVNPNSAYHADFYNTEGLKKDIVNSKAVKVDLYVDNNWLDKPMRAGLWGTGFSSGDSITAYPIVEFTTQGEGGFTGWRVWNGAGWNNLSGVTYDSNSWNTLEIILNPQTSFFDLYVNGAIAKTNMSNNTSYIGEVILNSLNYETTSDKNYVVRWSKLATGQYSPDSPASSFVTITGNTSAGENLPGWLFNRDVSNATPIEFNADTASTGTGSLHVLPLSSTPAHKFIGELFAPTKISELNSAAFDFKIGAGGTVADVDQFYMNVYANFGTSATTKFYDCRYDVVATTGSTGSFTSVTFDPTQNYPVTKHASSPFTCPSSPAAMNLSAVNSFVRAFVITMGDSTASDQGLDGYFDNFVLNTTNAVTTYNFEPFVNLPPTVNFVAPTPSEGEVVSGAVTGHVLASDDHGMSSYFIRVWKGAFESGPANLLHECASAPGGFALGTSQDINCVFDTTGQPDGTYVFSAQFLDGHNVWGQALRTITIDTTAPSVPNITFPNPEQNFITTPIPNQWTAATDSGSGVAGYQIAYNYDDGHNFGSSTCPGLTIAGYSGFIGCRDVNGLSRNHSPSDSEQGGVTIWVRAIDNAGNVSEWSAPRHYYYDKTPPTAPTLLGWKNSNDNDVPHEGITNLYSGSAYWTASSSSDVAHYIYKYWNDIPSSPYNDEASAWTTTTGGITLPGEFNQGEGKHFFCVVAVDHVGQQSPCSVPFAITYDATAPDVPAAVMTQDTDNGVVPDKGYTNSLHFTVGLTSSSDVTRYQLKYWNAIPGDAFNGESNAWSPNNITATGHMAVLGIYTDLFTRGEGTHYFAFSACDSADNCSSFSAPFEVTYDITPPAITINELVTSNGSPELTGTVDDPDAIVEVEVNGQVYGATNNGDGTWTLPAGLIDPVLTPNLYNVVAVATDLAGNSGLDATDDELSIGAEQGAFTDIPSRTEQKDDTNGQNGTNGTDNARGVLGASTLADTGRQVWFGIALGLIVILAAVGLIRKAVVAGRN